MFHGWKLETPCVRGPNATHKRDELIDEQRIDRAKFLEKHSMKMLTQLIKLVLLLEFYP